MQSTIAVTTDSGFPFRSRRADLRPRARAFPRGARARRPGADVLARLRPEAAEVPRGDTEYCISAVPLGGYVKLAGENPEDIAHRRARRVPVEEQVGAVPGPRHGPGHEPRCSPWSCWRSCSTRARWCRRTEIGRPSSASLRRGVRGAEGRPRARRSRRQRRRPAGRRPGTQFDLMVAAEGRTASVRLGIQRDGQAIEYDRRAGAIEQLRDRATSASARSFALRSSTPSPASRRPRPASQAATSSSPSTGEPTSRRSRSSSSSRRTPTSR